MLETERLILRSHRIEQVATYSSWWNNPDLMNLDSDDPEIEKSKSMKESLDLLQDWITSSIDDGRINYAIDFKPLNKLIGYGKIDRIDNFNRHCSIGIMIGEEEFWGQGIGHEALTAVINFCFNELNLNRISTKIFSYNERSIKLFRKLGFTLEGTERMKILKEGKYFDDLNFGLLRSEWSDSH